MHTNVSAAGSPPVPAYARSSHHSPPPRSVPFAPLVPTLVQQVQQPRTVPAISLNPLIPFFPVSHVACVVKPRRRIFDDPGVLHSPLHLFRTSAVFRKSFVLVTSAASLTPHNLLALASHVLSTMSVVTSFLPVFSWFLLDP